METIKIPFTGINRSIDDGMSADGQCMELINARIKNGTAEPIGRPIVLGAIPVEVDRMYWHSNAKKYVGVNTTSGKLYSINEDLSSYTTIAQVEGIKDIAFLGNVLCISDDNGIEYALWNGTTYDFLGVAPELPDITIQYSVAVQELIPDRTFSIYSDSDIENGKISVENFINNSRNANSVGYYDNCISSLNAKKNYVSPCLVRYGFRLSGGGYLSLSPVILVETNAKIKHNPSTKDGYGPAPEVTLGQGFPFSWAVAGQVDGSYINFMVLGTKLYFSFDSFKDISNWKSLITSLDIFVSPVNWFEKKEKKYKSATYTEWTAVKDDRKSILDAYTFYKVAEFDLKGNRTWEIDNVSIDNLSIQEKLEETPTGHTNIASMLYVYNSRMHISGLKQIIFKGYGKNAYINRAGVEATLSRNRDIYVYINTENGISVVKKSINSINDYVPPIITYPDSRAYKMVIQWDSGTSPSYKVSKTIELKKHPYLNIAYYLYNTLSRYEAFQNGDNAYNNEFRLDLTKNTETGITCQEQNTEIDRPNILKVSSLNNPLSFPAAQTYQPSQGEIVGILSNTTALSQGQFGQHPLYVFSSDGIYAMQVDTTGQTVYSAQTPVSRDVCVNPKSVTGIDNAVVFASKRGLMAINGTSVTMLSQEMDGYLPSCIDSSPIIPKIAKVASFENALSTTTFNDYIENASVSYNYQENELIVTNPDYTYAYVYNINSASWTKISPNPKFFVNRYPECYGVADNILYDMQNDHRSIATVLLLTKPIKMGTLAHKRILQSALRGIVKRSLSDLYLRGEPVLFRGESLDIFSDVGLYILGSNDAEHFTLVSGKESIVDIRDLVTKMNKSKAYKYFMVALAGGIRTDVSLNYMEFIASESFNNRLR